jgi:YD repeat-containing protein
MENGFIINQYDENGLLTLSYRMYEGSRRTRTEYEYEKNTLIRKTERHEGSYEEPWTVTYTYHYDANGRKVGSSSPGFLGSTTHRDADGRTVGSSQAGLFSTHHYDNKGRRIGETTPGFFGSKKTKFGK